MEEGDFPLMNRRLSRKWMQLATLAVLAACGLLSGCGGFFQAVNNNPTSGTTSYVYVANISTGATGGTLSEYTMTAGVLTAISGSPIALPAVPTSVVVAPNNGFVYVGTTTGVFLYTIGTGGALTEGNNNTVVYLGPSQPQALAIDSTSSWLVIANKNSTELDALQISPTTGIPSSSVVSASLSSATPLGIAMTAPTSNVSTLFVALGVGGTEAISFDAANAKPFASTATDISLASGSTSATAVGIDPTSTYAYITEDAAPTNVLRTMTIKTLTQDGLSYAVGGSPTAVLADSTGAYVYVANAADNTISGFSQSAGSLTGLTDSPFATAKTATGLAEDSSHTYVLAVGSGANPNLWVYKFDATSLGTLDVASTLSTSSSDPSGAIAIALSH
jgi:DNA-binding beta-propeller fold protein YncE